MRYMSTDQWSCRFKVGEMPVDHETVITFFLYNAASYCAFNYRINYQQPST